MNVNVSSFTDKLFSSDVDIVLNVHNKQRDYSQARVDRSKRPWHLNERAAPLLSGALIRHIICVPRRPAREGHELRSVECWVAHVGFEWLGAQPTSLAHVAERAGGRAAAGRRTGEPGTASGVSTPAHRGTHTRASPTRRPRPKSVIALYRSHL